MAPDPSIAEEIRRFRAQYARNPEGFAFARLADAYRKAGDPERALDLLDRGLERHPRYLSGHVVRARALLGAGRREEALEAFRRVLELDPQNGVALGALARMARQSGRLEDAVAAYRRLREVEPLDEEVRERLADAERSRRREGLAAEKEPGGEGEPAEGDVVADEPVGSETGERPGAAGAVESEPLEKEPSAESRGEGPREAGADASSPDPDDEDVVVTATMGDLLLRQELYEQAARTFERLLKGRPGDPFLIEKLRTARQLARGEGVARRPADREGPSGPEGRGGSLDAAEEHASPAGASGGKAAREPSEARGTSPPPARDGGGPPTIRGYLGRLLEGRAEADSDRGASRFELWLRRAREG